jgi:hypothetical protein
MSGGVNFRQLAPSAIEPLLVRSERLAKPLSRHWSLHQATVIRKL